MSDPKNLNQLFFFKNGVFAGKLLRTAQGCQIVFDTEFLSENKDNTFTFKLKPQTKPVVYSGVNLPSYFAGLLPEGLRLKFLVRRLKTSEDDLFSLLIAAGSDPVGDIHFSTGQKNISFPMFEAEHIQFKNFELLKTKIKFEGELTQKAIAGVQNKISADRLSLPFLQTRSNKSYILKFSSEEFKEIVENEMTSLNLAKKCGIEVNAAKVIQDESGETALLVQRFDRIWDVKTKVLTRYHQEDACQFLDRYPSDKYILSFQEVAQGIADHATSPEIEILNLLKVKAFSYLIGNGDMHGKNVSLLQKGQHATTQLSPQYDIVCTALYGDQKMALQMDGKNQNLKRKNFVDFGTRFGIPSPAIESMLNKLLVRFQKNKNDFFAFPLAKKKEKFLNVLFTERGKHLA
jgi:serine/threonine-protein kinase HipA